MTTFFDFQPSPQQLPSFTVTLDGAQYVLTMPWNLFGQRYYVNCSDLEGNLIFLLPLIGSPDGLIAQSIAWDNGEAIVTTTEPHGYRVGTTINLTLRQAAPDAYNGSFDFLVEGPDTLSYPLASNPGVNTSPGILYNDINLAAGYFETSTLVYRTSSSQLEVNP